MSEMTEQRLKEIESRLAAASRGPWVYDGSRHTHDSPIYVEGATPKNGYIGAEAGGVVGSSEWIWLTEQDGRFIAGSWADVRDLLAEVKRLRGELSEGDA